MSMLLLAAVLIGSSLAMPNLTTAELHSCSADEFQCLDLVCIPNTKVCDGEKDCFLHEDEVNCPKEKKSCEYGICSQICTNGHGNYSCSCYPNYKMIKGSCYVKGEDPVLYITAKDSILHLNLRTNHSELIVGGLGRPVDVAYNGLDNKIYWTDVDTNTVESMDKDAKQRTILGNGWDIPYNIITDEASGNFYVSNKEKGQIVACLFDGTACVVIDDKCDKPRGLAIHYKEMLLFFTDWGSYPAVIRMRLDGSERQEIATENLLRPNCVAVDQLMDRVYWADAKFDTIESANLDGSDRRIVLQETEPFRPFNLEVFEDTLYWSDWDTYEVVSCNKFTGKERKVFRKEANLMGITLYHPTLQSGLDNPCLGRQCSHLCLPRSSYSSICACPDEMELYIDTNTCVMKGSLMIAVNEKLFSINTDLYTTEPEVSIRGKVKYMATDKMNGDLFVFNNESTIYKINLYEYEKQVVSINPSILHMAYDSINENIYWIDSERKSIFVHSIKAKVSKAIVKDLVNPKAIAFGIKCQCIIFLDGPKVKVASKQGESLQYIKDKLPPTIQHVHYVEAYHILLLSDPSYGIVYQLDVRTGRLDVFFTGIFSIGSMTVFSNRFYWTQHIGSEIFWIEFQKYSMTLNALDGISWMSLTSISDSPLNSVQLGVSTNLTTLYKDIPRPCQEADCQQFCFSYSGQAKCSCEDDLYLQEDGKSCHSIPSHDSTSEADNNPREN